MPHFLRSASTMAKPKVEQKERLYLGRPGNSVSAAPLAPAHHPRALTACPAPQVTIGIVGMVGLQRARSARPLFSKLTHSPRARSPTLARWAAAKRSVRAVHSCAERAAARMQSTLFNCLSHLNIPAENYPFWCARARGRTTGAVMTLG